MLCPEKKKPTELRSGKQSGEFAFMLSSAYSNLRRVDVAGQLREHQNAGGRIVEIRRGIQCTARVRRPR
jgi:hypothetical protein